MASKVTFNDAKTEATLTSDNKLVAGKYSVNITGVEGLEKADHAFEVAAEKLTSVRLAGTTVKPNNAAAPVTVEGLNQYGEVLTNVQASDFVWSAYDQTAKLNLTVSTSTNTITLATNTSGVKVGDQILVTAVNKADSSVTLSTTITVSDAAMKDITFGQLVLPKDETRLMQKGSAVFYELPYTLTDLNDNKVTLDDVTATALTSAVTSGGVVFSTDKSAVLDQVKVENGKLYVRVASGQAGDVKLIASLPASGKVVVLPITINKPSDTDSITLGAQPKTLTAGASAVKIPVTVSDQYGKTYTAAEFISAGTGDFTIGSSNPAVATAVLNADGKTLDVTPVGEGTATITITNSNSGKQVTYVADVKKAAVPTTFNAVLTGTNLTVGATSTVKAEVFNQYGDKMTASELAAYQFIVTQPTSGDVTVSGSPATVTASNMLNTGFVVTGANADTSSKVSVRLEKTSGNVEVVTKDITFNVVKSTTAVTYSLTEVPTLYGALAAGKVYTDTTDRALGADAGTTAVEYAKDLKFVAKDASGNVINVPATWVKNVVAVGDNAAAVSIKSDFTKIVGNTWADDAATKEVTLVATIQNPDGTLQVINSKVTVAKAAPKATKLTVWENVSADTDKTNDVEITSGTLDLTTTQLTALGTNVITENAATTGTAFYFQVEDQYGVTSLSPIAFNSTIIKAVGTNTTDLSINPTSGAVEQGAGAEVAGDKIQIQAVDQVGNSKVLTITIK